MCKCLRLYTWLRASLKSTPTRTHTHTCTHVHANRNARHNAPVSTQVQYSGRQVGGKILPGSARAANKAKSGAAQLMPTEPELLADAQNWVDKWPGAVGHTNMLSSYLMADSYWNADCW